MNIPRFPEAKLQKRKKKTTQEDRRGWRKEGKEKIRKKGMREKEKGRKER